VIIESNQNKLPYQTTAQSTTLEIRTDILKDLLQLGKSLREKSIKMQEFLFGQLTTQDLIFIEEELEKVNELIRMCINCNDNRKNWNIDDIDIIYKYYDGEYSLDDFINWLIDEYESL
jgi:hypothetical protein